MAKKRIILGLVFALLSTVFAAGVFAQVTISGGFALSSMSAEVGGTSISGDIGVGGNIYVDYLLPIGVPMSLGVEVGFDTASITDNGYTVTGNAIPLLLRAAYHFDLMASLDLYLVGKVGYVLGSAEADGSSEDGYNGIGFGADIGVAFYFASAFGIFGEAGFDRYNLEKDIEGTTIKVPFSRFVTVGISLKF
jgi:hypothetical protein